MKFPKYMEAEGVGFVCYTCHAPLNFIGCYIHEHSYPKIAKSGRVQVPLCKECSFICTDCETTDTPYALGMKHKKYKLSKKKPKLAKKKSDITVKTKEELATLIPKLDLKDARTLNLFKKTTKNSLDTVFAFEIGNQLAIKEVSDKVKDRFNMNSPNVSLTTDRLSTLLYLVLQIRTSGLGRYEQVIMEAEIERLFGPAKGKLAQKEDNEDTKQLAREISRLNGILTKKSQKRKNKKQTEKDNEESRRE